MINYLTKNFFILNYNQIKEFTLIIRKANINDINLIITYDRHISLVELKNIIKLKRVLIIEENKKLIGILRYNMFWDNTPFLNMLYILEEYRLMGYGKMLLTYWEDQMYKLNYSYVLTSTVYNEDAKEFYQKQGYKRIGKFTLEDEPLEIILTKKLIRL